MAFNVNSFKKWLGLALPPTITGLSVLISVVAFRSIWISIGTFILMTMISILLGNIILRNPFSQLLEGQGILTIDINSTGIMNLFISTIRKPYIENEKESMTDIFDRETVFNLNPPVHTEPLQMQEDGSLSLKLTKEDFNRAKFGMMQYPVLIWNSQIKSLLTKDFLSEQEKVSFSEHSIIYQNQKLHELTNVVRDFARHVVEQLNPHKSTSLFQNKWFWIIIVIFGIIALALFLPSIIGTIKGGASQVVAAAAPPASTSGQLITPR